MGPFSKNSNAGGATVVTTTTTTTTPHGHGHGHNNSAAYPNTRAGHGAKPSLMDRLKGDNTHTTHTQSAPVVAKKSRFGGSNANRRVNKPAVPNGTTKNGVPRRKVGLGDKMSGAMLKAKGSMTHRPGEKAAGTRRMHGTDGKGSTRTFY